MPAEYVTPLDADNDLAAHTERAPLRIDGEPVRNRLLSSLHPRELAAMRPHLKASKLAEHQVLFEAESHVGYVYFPESAIISLASLRGERMLAVGTVGAEGMVGLGVFLGEPISFVRASVIVPGIARRLRAPTFRRLARQLVGLRRSMLSYTRSFVAHLNQRENCGSAHPVEQRCARWLLVTSDRIGTPDFPLTLEFLALMVGVRRGGVAVGVRTLQDRHLIHYDNDRVEILDRAGLEGATCECYGCVPAADSTLAVS